MIEQGHTYKIAPKYPELPWFREKLPFVGTIDVILHDEDYEEVYYFNTSDGKQEHIGQGELNMYEITEIQ